MEAVLRRTLALGLKQSKQPNVEQLELKLVRSLRDIENPKITVEVTEISGDCKNAS